VQVEKFPEDPPRFCPLNEEQAAVFNAFAVAQFKGEMPDRNLGGGQFGGGTFSGKYAPGTDAEIVRKWWLEHGAVEE
jgi:hypothetical protein